MRAWSVGEMGVADDADDAADDDEDDGLEALAPVSSCAAAMAAARKWPWARSVAMGVSAAGWRAGSRKAAGMLSGEIWW